LISSIHAEIGNEKLAAGDGSGGGEFKSAASGPKPLPDAF
jgi:hypothetical protein